MEPNYKEEYHYKAARKKVKDIKGFYTHLLVYLFVNIAIFILASRDESFLSAIQEGENYLTAFFWGIGVLAHWASVFGSNLIFGKEWEARKIRELMEKEQQKKWE